MNTEIKREMDITTIEFSSYEELKKWAEESDGTDFCYWGLEENFKLGLTIDELRCDMREDWFNKLIQSEEFPFDYEEVKCPVKIYSYNCWFVLYENKDRTDGEVFFFNNEEDAIDKANSIWNRIDDKNKYVDVCFSNNFGSYDSVYNPKEAELEM